MPARARYAIALAFVSCGRSGAPELLVKQYDDVAVPAVDGALIHVSDIRGGKSAEVWIKLHDREIARGDLEVADDLPFVVGGVLRVAHVASYKDDLIEDEARFRIEERAPEGVFRLGVGSSAAMANPHGTVAVTHIAANQATLQIDLDDGRSSPTLFVGETATRETGRDRHVFTLLALGEGEAFVRLRTVRR